MLWLTGCREASSEKKRKKKKEKKKDVLPHLELDRLW